MKTKEYHFTSSNQINQIYGIAKIPNKIKGYVQIIHDKYDYISRYEKFLEFLADRGFLAYGIDLIGHGNSVTEEHPLGDLRGDNIPNIIVDDLSEMANKVFSDFPVENEYVNVKTKGKEMQMLKPLLHTVIGVGLGASIARYYVWKAKNVNALITIGDVGFSTDIKKAIKIYKKEESEDKKYLASEELTEYLEKSYNEGIDDSKLYRNSYRLSDTKDIRILNKDEKCNFFYTNYAYKSLLLIQNMMNLRQWFAICPKYLPIYMLSGANDPVTNYTEEIENILKQIKKTNIRNVFYKYYVDLRHDILFENKKEVYLDIITFLTVVLKSQDDTFKERKEFINA